MRLGRIIPGMRHIHTSSPRRSPAPATSLLFREGALPLPDCIEYFRWPGRGGPRSRAACSGRTEIAECLRTDQGSSDRLGAFHRQTEMFNLQDLGDGQVVRPNTWTSSQTTAKLTTSSTLSWTLSAALVGARDAKATPTEMRCARLRVRQQLELDISGGAA
jgi:hypothetical protein